MEGIEERRRRAREEKDGEDEEEMTRWLESNTAKKKRGALPWGR